MAGKFAFEREAGLLDTRGDKVGSERRDVMGYAFVEAERQVARE